MATVLDWILSMTKKVTKSDLRAAWDSGDQARIEEAIEKMLDAGGYEALED